MNQLPVTMLESLLYILQELVMPYLGLVLMCFVYVKYSSINRLITRTSSSKSRKNVLLLTAHPDDECMFFTPTILSLLNEGHNVSIVCLSKGDFCGQGELRKKELVASCSKLGISSSRVTVVDDENLKDGLNTIWDSDLLGERILSVSKRVNAESIITFDSGGVSSHPNHIAIYTAIEKLHQLGKLKNISVFTLETTSLLRKYISLFDIPVSSFICLTTFICSPQEVLQGWKAMAAHKSQLVWFRRLYIVFSRYMFVNTLQEMRVTNGHR